MEWNKRLERESDSEPYLKHYIEDGEYLHNAYSLKAEKYTANVRKKRLLNKKLEETMVEQHRERARK